MGGALGGVGGMKSDGDERIGFAFGWVGCSSGAGGVGACGRVGCSGFGGTGYGCGDGLGVGSGDGLGVGFGDEFGGDSGDVVRSGCVDGPVFPDEGSDGPGPGCFVELASGDPGATSCAGGLGSRLRSSSRCWVVRSVLPSASAITGSCF